MSGQITEYLSNPSNPSEKEEKARLKMAKRKNVIGDSPEEKLMRDSKQQENILTHFGNPETQEIARENENTEKLNQLLDKSQSPDKFEEAKSETEAENWLEDWEKSQSIKSLIRKGWDKVAEKIGQLKGDGCIPWEESPEEEE